MSEPIAQRQIDSLASTGGHGFYTAQYIVGRYKNTPILDTRFHTEVLQLDPLLIEEPLQFHMLDTTQFQLQYAFDGRQRRLTGRLGERLVQPELDIVVGISYPINHSRVGYLEAIDYEWRIHRY